MYGACFCALLPIKFLPPANLAVDFGFLQGPTVHPPTQCLPAVEKKIDRPPSYDRRAACFSLTSEISFSCPRIWWSETVRRCRK